MELVNVNVGRVSDFDTFIIDQYGQILYPLNLSYSSLGGQERVSKLTTHVHLVLKLKMRGAVPHSTSWRGASSQGQLSLICLRTYKER